MNAPARLKEQPNPPAVVTDAAGLMQVITRAASDPGMDVEKLERLMSLYERVNASSAEQSYHDAMNQAQAEMGPIAVDSTNSQTSSKYASYPALDRALRPIYTKHGFSLSYDTGDSPKPDHVRVLCRVAHRDGHKEIHHADLPADGLGAKGGAVMTKTHASGAAFSYGQRYLLKLVFNISTGESDDDGNSATVTAHITDDQVSDLVALMEEVGADRDRFLNYLRIDTLAHLPANRLDAAIKALEAKRRAR